MKSLLLFILLQIPLLTADNGEYAFNRIAKSNEARRQAEQAWQNQNYVEVTQQYNYLTDSLKQPDLPATLNKAHAYYKQDSTTRAKAYYQELALSSDKKVQSVAWQQLGLMAYKAQQLKEAAALFKNALKANPANEEARRNYELVKRLMENKDQNKKDDNQNKEDQKNEQDKKDEQQDKDKENKDQQNGDQDKDQQNEGQEGEKDGQKGDQKDQNKDGESKEKEDKSQDQKKGKDGGKKDDKKGDKDPKEGKEGQKQDEKEGDEKEGKDSQEPKTRRAKKEKKRNSRSLKTVKKATKKKLLKEATAS